MFPLGCWGSRCPPGMEGNAALPVAQGQSWESMSGWAGCLLSDALGDGKKLWQDSRPPPIYPWPDGSECKTSAPAACARLGPAPAPGAAADSLPGRRSVTRGSRIAPRPLPGLLRQQGGLSGSPPLSAEILEWCRERPDLITQMTPVSGVLLHSMGLGGEGVHPGSPHSKAID